MYDRGIKTIYIHNFFLLSLSIYIVIHHKNSNLLISFYFLHIKRSRLLVTLNLKLPKILKISV